MSETLELIDHETLDGGEAGATSRVAAVPTLTIAAHPQAARVGELCPAPALARARGVLEVSRASPPFVRLADGRERALVTPFISRQPVRFVGGPDGGITVDPGAGRTPVAVDGVKADAPLQITADLLRRGVTIELGRHLVLVLGLRTPPPGAAGDAGDDLGLVGATDAMTRVRAAIRRAGPSGLPVLIRGETGSGKELVARALHAVSDRAGEAFVAVNMAAVPSSLAASELFGHARGAFSGARDEHDGYFVRADEGTLFLDEIGDAPDEVQASLLRVLETGEVQRVGARRMRRVDVRLVAATDADLEASAAAGRFRAPLLYRLATQEIRVPPLRERRADVGRLLVAFLSERLAELGEAARLAPPPTQREVWLTAPLVARLVRYDWPGNVRQLSNVAQALAARALAPEPLAADDPDILRLLEQRTPAGAAAHPGAAGAPPTAAASAPARAPRRPRDIGQDELYEVMVKLAYRLGPTAAHFGISRPSLNALVDAHPRLVRPSTLSAEQIAAGRAGAGERPLWQAMEVSERGLARRLKALGLT